MLTPQINYHEAVKRLCQYVDEYNANCTTLEYTKKVVIPGTGELVTKTYSRKQGTIKASVKATAMHLIAQYIEAWATANRALHNMARPADVYIKTNRVEIGERLNRSYRSVYDHILKLRSVGIVDNYEFCGRQHSFKLWISPKILFGEAGQKPPQLSQNAPKTPVSDSVRQNLPPIYKSQKQPSTTISADECGKPRIQNHGNNEDPRSPSQNGKKPLPSMPGTETGEPGGGGGRAADPRRQELEKGFGRLPKYLQELVYSFWLLARTSLYNRNQWSNDDNSLAVLEIYTGVFGRFAVSQSDKAWEEYYNELAERVTLARTWFEKNAHRKPDMPFQCGKKMGYFDPKNNFGFKITADWLAKDKLRKRENRIEYLLNQARIDFERLALGNPRLSMVLKDELQLFIHYQNLAKTYGKECSERFINQYMEQKARKFLPKRPPRPTIRAQKAADKAIQTVYVEPWMSEMGEGFYSY